MEVVGLFAVSQLVGGADRTQYRSGANDDRRRRDGVGGLGCCAE